MLLYNTITRKKEVFNKNKDEDVKIYSCGPTVYNYAHIGNLRTYVFMDSLRRVLNYNGYKLKHVMNITDVGHLVSDEDDGEDKMIKGAREQNKTPWEIADYYTEVFFNDINNLNIEKPEFTPKATEHISEMIGFVEGLVEKGYGYVTSDGIYFDIKKFSGYGKLSNIDLDELEAGKRVEINEEKRHPADFALWKNAPKEHIMQWNSPWGMGYPGWHIECSAMSKKYLGEVFDIHTGGVDHIPIHHENEIAQSEALTSKNPSEIWMHAEFMMVNNGKMSKSLNNAYTINNLKEKGFDPLAFKYFCLNAHYRNKLNFTWDAMKSSQVSYIRLLDEVLSHKNSQEDIDENIINKFRDEFNEAINDDLNIPKAVGVLWNAVRYYIKSYKLYKLILEMDQIFGLGLENGKEKELNQDIEKDVIALLDKRNDARENKNWAQADLIRDEIQSRGYLIEDTKDGVKLRKI